MVQGTSSGPSDFPPSYSGRPPLAARHRWRRLLRQLDFTTSYSGGPLLAAAREAASAPTPQSSPQKQHLTCPTAPILRLSVPISVKPESPKSRPRPIYEVKDGTPTRKKNCNCKHSRCLKLYCDCFSAGVYCDGCNCANCCNNEENEAARHEAVEVILERIANAFRPKIGSSPHAVRDNKGFHESRMGRQLVSVYGQQDEYSKEEIIDAVEKCMKKYADNLLRHLDGISGRLSQLEIYCYKLERSIGEFQADMIRDQSQADTKLKSLEKHLQEVHRSIQILRDKQELAETQKELTRLQLAPRESASTTKYQNNEDTISSSSVPEPKRHDDTPKVPSQHLALALPTQIPVSSCLPTRTPEMNQLPIQQQQQPPALAPPHNHYTPQQPAPFYSQQSQALQPETQAQYIQPRAQIQEPSQAPPPQHQPHIANQPQNPQPFPQYQQQHWPQPSPQQLTQQAMAPTQPPTSQSQLARPQTPPSYIPYTHQPNNQETFAHSTVPQAGVNQSSFGMPSTKPIGYASASPYAPQPNVQGYNTVYSSDGSRVQAYQRGNYPPPSNVSGMQNQQLLPGNSSGFHVRSHPYMDMIEKAVSMGYPRDQVVGVVNRMAESGQPVDFNALLDRLNSGPAAGGSRW